MSASFSLRLHYTTLQLPASHVAITAMMKTSAIALIESRKSLIEDKREKEIIADCIAEMKTEITNTGIVQHEREGRHHQLKLKAKLYPTMKVSVLK